MEFDEVDRTVEGSLWRPTKFYFAGLAITVGLLLMFKGAWIDQVIRGIGLSSKTNPAGWTLYITTFVFWVGIAHSGTLISAILYLFRAKWRTSIYRAAEAMTVFAIMTAGLFPLIHLGRLWRMYYILPIPNQRELWPNFTSPLMWDVVAVNTYLTVSTMFFYLGLIPDIASLRDRTHGLKHRIYALLALNWVGSENQWRYYKQAYMFFAALATPLVISVHSVVSWDFAVSIIPGWHSTIFAPYFVAGAIHSGLAMVLTLLIPLRSRMKYKNLIRLVDLENVAKTLVFTGLIVGYSYITEFFVAWYSGNGFEKSVFLYRAVGDYKAFFWTMFTCNAIVPLFFLSKRIRTSIPWLFVISILVNIGMWCERFVIITTSLSHDFLPYSWGTIKMTPTDLMIVIGSFGLFLTLFLIFSKTLPPVATTEMKEAIELEREDLGLAGGAH
ncbi:MAG: hydrogenase [Candidatus Hydrogenedentota bacterium]|nr:MAG: hydrogenase [Candidatus Hydrogenedentota bacterium]